MITGLAHVCFTVNDLEQSIAFYCDTLGFKRAFDFHDDHGTLYGAYVKAGPRIFIELFKGTASSELDGQSYRHICLEVDDIQSTTADLQAKGIEVSTPELGLDQSWQAWLADPDGNRIELHQYTPESWQAPHLD